MLIGIIGAPNKGKSTLFSAMTMIDVDIADYPFTTINPNYGVAYATRGCVERELKVKCNPRNSLCRNGTRYLPINVIDVAGLVPGAHIGRGMGNKFLNDLINADALIQVVDLTGRTDLEGNHCSSCNPADEVRMVGEELKKWLAGVIKRNISNKSGDAAEMLSDVFTSLNIKQEVFESMLSNSDMPLTISSWSDEDLHRLSENLLRISKPVVVAANKLDAVEPGALDALKKELKGYEVVGCSAAIELALRKAEKSKLIDYAPGERGFEIIGGVSGEQRKALGYMLNFIKGNGTGVQELLDRVVFGVLGLITVYPVEDENKYTDHFGNVLPDALLLKNGSTALDLAERIHTDLARHMLYAINARTKMRINKEQVLKDNDVIKIVSSAR